MLHIILDDADRTLHVTWHVGQSMPIAYANVPLVREIQADNDELDRIRRQISNVPTCNQRVVRWFGDDARFIVANLDYSPPKLIYPT